MTCLLVEYYNDLVENQGDPRSNNLLFIKSPCFTLTMVFIYLFFSIYAGPKFMKNRRPYVLTKLVIFYNLIHMCLSVYLVYWASTAGWFSKFDNWFCVPTNFNDVEPSTLDLVNNSWWFFLSRFFEFTDTVFFVLRKKDKQISSLHLIHHSTVPIITWIGMKFVPIGHFTFAGYVNGYVHIVMYTYYMLSAMGPSMRKYLWWKKYLTGLQLIQFVIVLSHTIIAINVDCPGPKWFLYILIGQAVMFFALFLQFYVGAYTKNQSKDQIKDNFIKKSFDKVFNFYHKIAQYRAFFEACVPNQNVLLDDSQDNNDEDNYEKSNHKQKSQ